jgi:hypothetical protein
MGADTAHVGSENDIGSEPGVLIGESTVLEHACRESVQLLAWKLRNRGFHSHRALPADHGNRIRPPVAATA